MKISYNWLKEYVGFNLEVDKISEILTDIGLEVEGFTELFASFDHLVIGKIIECYQHPNADKLKLTKVDVGGEIKTIICGAPNVAKDLIVVVVHEGNSIVNLKGESFKIKESKIRGQLSQGMICSGFEIGLNADKDGIIIIDDDSVKIGSLAKDYFNISRDYCFEIGITPNRTDALSHFGVARDLHAYLMTHNLNSGYKYSLDCPNIKSYKSIKDDLKINVDVIDDYLCPLYLGVSIENVIVKDSPQWLKNKLTAVGISTVNNVVDITNFVLHETGNPLHAFDYNKISNNQIVIRKAKLDEPFIGLDGRTSILSDNNLVISDNDNNVLCLAGIMGGESSAVNNLTENIFLECAYFDPSSIRRTSKEHGIMSDSSYRFERGVDYNNCAYALKRAAILIRDICGGVICSNLVCNSKKLLNKEVLFSFERFTKIVGEYIDQEIIIGILKNLDFIVSKKSKDELLLKIPSFRADVYREIDVVEEILRVYGYNNIKTAQYVNFNTDPIISYNPKLSHTISKFLAFNGFFEIKNNSLTNLKSLHYNNNYFNTKEVRLVNPLSQDLSVMRTNLLYGGLQTIKYNLNRQQDSLKLYEFGKVYSKSQDGYIENDRLGIFISGTTQKPHWKDGSKEVDFFIAKGILDQIFSKFCKNSSFSIKESQTKYFEIGASYYHDKKLIADLGLIDLDTLKSTGIKQPVYFIDVNLELFLSLSKNNEIEFKKIPKYPKITRDLSLLLDVNISYEEIELHARGLASNLLIDIYLFDVYQGDKISKDKKSYAISFVFRDDETTLTDAEIDREMIKIYKGLKNKYNLTLRDGELG